MIVVFDNNEAHLHGRGPDGRVNYDVLLPWPESWPPHITGRWLSDRGIPWIVT